MPARVFRFCFLPDVSLDEVEMTLQLATFAAEGLFGMARVRLEFGYHVDIASHVILADGTHEIGAVVVHLFAGLLLRELGEEAFRMERIPSAQRHPQEITA